MKVLVTGVAGQLGHDVMNELAKQGIEGIGSDIADTYAGIQDGTAVTTMRYVSIDLTDSEAVEARILFEHPDAIIHCAAWTAVDAAEEEENQAKVRNINFGGTKNVAKVCAKLDIPMMYLSTDYVFDGQGTRPWEPDWRNSLLYELHGYLV